ncbi:MAG: hypothetical protein P1U36_10155 [Legionellaceae bacterium]|nr:hypothetical protein [Legionellaceae bacterium]
MKRKYEDSGKKPWFEGLNMDTKLKAAYGAAVVNKVAKLKDHQSGSLSVDAIKSSIERTKTEFTQKSATSALPTSKRAKRDADKLWNQSLDLQDDAVNAESIERCIFYYEKALASARQAYATYETQAQKESVHYELISNYESELHRLHAMPEARESVSSTDKHDQAVASSFSGDALWNMALTAENAANRSHVDAEIFSYYERAKSFAEQARIQYLAEAESVRDLYPDKAETLRNNAQLSLSLVEEYKDSLMRLQGNNALKAPAPIDTSLPEPSVQLSESSFFSSPSNIRNMRTLQDLESLDACTFLNSRLSQHEKLSQIFQRLLDVKQSILLALDTKSSYYEKKQALFELLQVSQDMTEKLIPWSEFLGSTTEGQAFMLEIAEAAKNIAKGAKNTYTLSSPKVIKDERNRFNTQVKAAHQLSITLRENFTEENVNIMQTGPS